MSRIAAIQMTSGAEVAANLAAAERLLAAAAGAGAKLAVLPENFALMARTDAERLGLDYRSGTASLMSTANGATGAWKIRLDTVRVGEISVNAVDAAVVDTPSMPPLLGMSFLNRMDLRREGQVLSITKRF